MREIKFRAWNPVSGSMFSPFNLYDHRNGNHCQYISGYGQTAIFMQFTGLKDKNGKEIYEGDIATGMVNNPAWNPLDDNSPVQIAKNMAVSYVDRGFWLTGEGFGWEGEDMVDWKNIEIIGNIFENPELITK